jgi:hypothetical protein
MNTNLQTNARAFFQTQKEFCMSGLPSSDGQTLNAMSRHLFRTPISDPEWQTRRSDGAKVRNERGQSFQTPFLHPLAPDRAFLYHVKGFLVRVALWVEETLSIV